MNQQLVSDMLNTPAPMVILQLDLTSTPIKVNETVVSNTYKIWLTEPSSKIRDLNLEGSIPSTHKHYIEVLGEVKLEYYVDLDIRSGVPVDLEAAAFTPQNHCYNLVIEVKDIAPRRTIVNAGVHGFMAWGSETISHWESLIPKRKYYIVRDAYSFYPHDDYILAWKTRNWLDSILNSLSEIPPIIKEIYDDNIVIAEGKTRFTSYGLVLLDSQEGLLESIADMFSIILEDYTNEYLRKYLLEKMGRRSSIKGNPFKALELLIGEEATKNIIKDLVRTCTPKDAEYLIYSISNHLHLDKNVLRRLFAKNRELNVKLKCSRNDCIIENIGDVSVIELKFKYNNDIVSWSRMLLDKSYSMKIAPKPNSTSVELEYY